MYNSSKHTYLLYSLFSSAIIAYGFILNQKIVYPPGQSCMFRSLFHFPCAGCGGSHAIQSLIRGSIPDAFRHNALISIVFISAVFVVVVLLVDWFFRRNNLLRIHKILKATVRDKRNAYAVAAGLILFWIYHIWKF